MRPSPTENCIIRSAKAVEHRHRRRQTARRASRPRSPAGSLMRHSVSCRGRKSLADLSSDRRRPEIRLMATTRFFVNESENSPRIVPCPVILALFLMPTAQRPRFAELFAKHEARVGDHQAMSRRSIQPRSSPKRSSTLAACRKAVSSTSVVRGNEGKARRPGNDRPAELISAAPSLAPPRPSEFREIDRHDRH